MASASLSAASSAHVVLPAETIARSPSVETGVAESVEQDHRFWGCELIEEAGILLRLPQVVMVTAQTMLHRFYYRKSLRDFDAFRVAIGCLFLAAKVEEQPKRIKDVLSVFYAMYRRRKWGKTTLSQQLLELESESYYLWRDWLIMVERQILIDLGFSLYNIMEHPHKYILYYIKILDGSKALGQKAWGFLNDSLRIDLCVRYRAEEIACAAIFISARQLQVKLPDEPMWFELFNVDRESLVAVAQEIMQLYARPKIMWLDALTKVDPFAIDDMPGEGSNAATPPPKLVDMPETATATAASPSGPPSDPAVSETTTMNTLVDENPVAAKMERARDEPSEKNIARQRGHSSSRDDRRPSSDSRRRDRDRDQDRDRDRDRRSRRSRSHSDDRPRRRSKHDRDHRSRSRSSSYDERRGSRHRSRRSRSRSRRR